MSYNPQPDPQNVSVVSAGITVTEANRFPVSLGSSNITITGDVNVGTTVSVTSTPQNPVHTHLTEVGTSDILNVPYLPVGISTANGNVVSISNTSFAVSSINQIISVYTEEQPGSKYSFNNHATNTNRGWTMDDTMRPVVSIRTNPVGFTSSQLADIIEYEIGNNNANQSTIVYEWYEGELNIVGLGSTASWTNVGTRLQYRVYQDKYSSNASNTFTQNSSTMRHSGIIIGKNSSGDEGPAELYGGASANILTLCMRRVDNSTKLDVWFAFTLKEYS